MATEESTTMGGVYLDSPHSGERGETPLADSLHILRHNAHASVIRVQHERL